MSNPLDAIMDWYTTARDSMRITKRVIAKGARGIVKREYIFANRLKVDSQRIVDDSIRELENVVVLALVAVFERALRQHFVNIVTVAFAPGDSVRDVMRERLVEDVEFWHFSNKLIDACTMVPEMDRGVVKQLVAFRNWVAHGHFTNVAPPISAGPTDAYKRLTAFLVQANVI